MSIQVIVDVNDISAYVTSVERRQSICDPIGEAIIGLSPNFPTRINTFEDVLIYENGTKVFTGYTTSVVKARMPIKATLTCSDVLIKAKQTWIGADYISDGESVKHWIRKFLKLSGIHNRSIEVGNYYQVYPGFGWGHTTAFAAIIQTLQMCPFQIYANRDGRVTLTRLSKDSPVKTINAHISYERTRNDSWIRNRAVVMGYGDIAADIYIPNFYLPNEIRTVTVATGSIYNYSLAEEIALEMLHDFSKPWDVKVVTIPGDPELEVGQAIRLVDSWSGFDDNCIIISLASLYESETYQVELSLDERCPKFWGWDAPPIEYEPQDIWAGCGASGAWRSTDGALNWVNRGLSGIQIYDMKVNPFSVTLPTPSETLEFWAATASGLYKTTTSGSAWSIITLPEPETGVGAPTAIAVACSKVSNGTVYVMTTTAIPGNRVWIYKTEDGGVTWAWVLIASDLPGGGNEQSIFEIFCSMSSANYRGKHKFVTHGGSLYITVNNPAFTGAQRRNAPGNYTLIGYPSTMPPWPHPPPWHRECCALAGDCPGGLWGGTWGQDDEWTIFAWNGAAWNPVNGSQQRGPPSEPGCSDIIPDGSSGAWAGSYPGPAGVDMYLTHYPGGGGFAHYDCPLPRRPSCRRLHKLGSRIIVGGLSMGWNRTRIVSFDGANWYDEWEQPAPAGTAVIGFAEAGGTLWACKMDRKLLYRSGNAWAEDTVQTPGGAWGNIWDVKSHGGQIYVAVNAGIMKRTPSGYKVVAVFTGAGLVRCIHYIGGVNKIWLMASTAEIDRSGECQDGVPPAAPSNRGLILDVDVAGEYVYATLLDPGGHPFVLRVATDLSDTTVVYDSTGAGTYAGVRTDPFSYNRVWIFGDFGAGNKVNYSNDQGDTWTNVDDPAWGGVDVIRPLLPDPFSSSDVLVVENIAGGIARLWRTSDSAATWEDRGPVDAANIEIQCGARASTYYQEGTFLGRLAAGANNILYSSNEGAGWVVRNTGFPANAPVTSLIITDQ